MLGITLTRRPHAASESGSIPMAGVPVDSVNAHVAKFVAAGYSVAICDQVRRGDSSSSSSSSSSSLLQRVISRIVTSGSAIDVASPSSAHPAPYLPAGAYRCTAHLLIVIFRGSFIPCGGCHAWPCCGHRMVRRRCWHNTHDSLRRVGVVVAASNIGSSRAALDE